MASLTWRLPALPCFVVVEALSMLPLRVNSTTIARLGLLPSQRRRYVMSAQTNGLRGWNGYLNLLESRPMVGGFLTGGLLWSLGDMTAQRLEGHSSTDLYRLAGSTVFGSVFAGAIASQWYHYLDIAVSRLPRGSWRFVGTKLLLELAIWHPVSLVAYWLTLGVAEGRAFSSTLDQMRNAFGATFALECMLWGPLDTVNFLHTPVRYQVAVVNVGCFVESLMLSYIHAHGIPSWPSGGQKNLIPAPVIV